MFAKRPWLVVLCTIGLALSQAATVRGDDGNGPRLSVAFEELSIGEALQTLAELTNRPITVVGPTGERQVFLTLRNATLHESLERILYPLDFVIEWKADEQVTVRIVDSTLAASQDPSKEIGPAENGIETTVWYPAEETDALPPAPGEYPVTVEELELAAATEAIDTGSLEAFPRSGADEMIVTEDDLAALAQSQTIRRAELEAFPPAEGEVGITAGELAMMPSVYATEEFLDLPLFPTEPGEVPVTLRDLEEMVAADAEVPSAPESIEDMFPPIE